MRRRVELRIAQAESLVVAKEEMAAAAAVALTPQTPLKAMSAAVRRMERATELLQQPVASAAPFASAAPAEETARLLCAISKAEPMMAAKQEVLAAAGGRPLSASCSLEVLRKRVDRMTHARELAQSVGAYGGRESTLLDERLALGTQLVRAKKNVAEALGQGFTAEQSAPELRAITSLKLFPVLEEASPALGEAPEVRRLRRRIGEVESLVAVKEEMANVAAVVATQSASMSLFELRPLKRQMENLTDLAERRGANSAPEAASLRFEHSRLQLMIGAKEEMRDAALAAATSLKLSASPCAASPCAASASASQVARMRRAQQRAKAAAAYGGGPEKEMLERQLETAEGRRMHLEMATGTGMNAELEETRTDVASIAGSDQEQVVSVAGSLVVAHVSNDSASTKADHPAAADNPAAVDSHVTSDSAEAADHSQIDEHTPVLEAVTLDEEPAVHGSTPEEPAWLEVAARHVQQIAEHGRASHHAGRGALFLAIRAGVKLKRRVESSKATKSSPRQPDSSSANSSEDREHDDGNWSAEGDGLHQGDNPRRSSSAGSTATSPSPLLDALAKRIAARRNSLSLEAETGDVDDGDGKK